MANHIQSNAAAAEAAGVLKFRTLWISDLHLGISHTRAVQLLDFLEHTHSDFLFLVGDVLDGWQLSKNWHWPPEHNAVFMNILNRANEGTKTVYIPGNHDEAVRDFCNQSFGGINIQNTATHALANGKRVLAMHGDEFDAVIGKAKWLAKIGDGAYVIALGVNYLMNVVRQRIGLPYWSLSAYLKGKVKDAVEHISAFDQTILAKAHQENVSGMICGHTHKAEIRTIGDITYYNDGDWVESGTALVEDFDGNVRLIDWERDREALLASLTATQVT